jgi:hypothetical protein
MKKILTRRIIDPIISQEISGVNEELILWNRNLEITFSHLYYFIICLCYCEFSFGNGNNTEGILPLAANIKKQSDK